MQDLYETEELFAQDADKLEQMMEEFSSLEGTLAQGVTQAAAAMKLYEDMSFLYEKLHVYANQKYHEDTANAKYQKMSGEMQILETRLGQSTQASGVPPFSLPDRTQTGTRARCPGRSTDVTYRRARTGSLQYLFYV